MLSVVNVLFQCLCYDSSPTVTFSSCRHVCVWPAVLPGWPSMLAKRMSELSVGYISIQADIEWSWPWSWSSSRNFWENNKKRWGSGKYMWPLLLAYIKTVINQIKCEKLHAAHFFFSFWDINSLFLLLTWKASLFLRCRLLSLRSVFCFSSSSSFSRARICSSKHIRASSLSISVSR